MKKPELEGKSNEVIKKLLERIMWLRDNTILEEFDLMEMISDEVKDIFSCDMDCSTCSHEELGHCMQNFKVANLYWLRKISQDEFTLKNLSEKLSVLAEGMIKALKSVEKVVNGEEIKEEDFMPNDIEVKEILDGSSIYS